MANRQQLYNAELQNDLDGKSKNINNVNQIDVIQTGNVYVDPALPEEIGKIDSLMAFKDLETAIRNAPPNYNIILRPGTYLYDDLIEIRRSHVNIIGRGAIISPATAGGVAGFFVTGSFVTIDGIIFDGLLEGSASDTGTTISVGRATNVTLQNLVIRDQQGDAITLSDRYSSCTISNCSISGCKNAILAGIETEGEDVTTLTISSNTIQNMRWGGIIVSGDSDLGVIANIKIVENDIVAIDQNGSAIYMSDASTTGNPATKDVMIAHNYLSRGYNAIFCQHSDGVTICNNSVAGMDQAMVYLNGCKNGTVNNNLLDGGNPTTGNPQAHIGVSLIGAFSASQNDTGPYVVTSNIVTGIISQWVFVNIANTNDTTISANQFTGACSLQAQSFNNLKINGNTFTVSGSDPVIFLTAAERGWDGCTITDNKFKTTGTRASLIQTTDTSGTGQKNITIVGNFSTEDAVYAQGIYDNVAGASPGRAFLHSNSPQSIVRTGGEYDPRYGWVNDYQASFEASHINIPADSTSKYKVGGLQVVGARITGWSLPTGTQTRTTFDPSTVTLAQLAQHVNALIHDLHIDTGHGLIGLVPANTPGYS